MQDKQIIIGGLSCDNCAEFKRCREQQTKKEYAINQVLQDIPSEYANIINRLKQIIPSITRCDYVLEKQLKRKEQELQQAMDNYVKLDLQRVKEYNELVDLHKAKEQECEALQMSDNEAREIVAELKAECEELKEKIKELNQGWIDCDKERNLQEANSEFRQRVINRYKQTLIEIKDMCSEINCESLMQNSWCGNTDFKMGCCEKLFKKQVLQKISEVLDD